LIYKIGTDHDKELFLAVQALQAHVRKEMKQFPDMNLILLDGREHTIYTIVDELRKLPKHTAVLLGTWRVDKNEGYFMRNATYSMMEAIPDVPTFTATSIGLGYWAVGGVVPVFRTFGKGLAEEAVKLLDNPEDPNMRVEVVGTEALLDSKKVKEQKIDVAALPMKVKLVNESPSFYKQYRYQIWVVLGQPLAEAAKVTLDYKAPIAAAIMVLMVAMMVFDFIPVAPVTAVMIAGLLMVLTGCFRNVEAAYKTINWETIVLFAAMLPMSLALEKTGASEYISNSLVSGLGSYGPIVLMAGIYFTTSLMTMFISNTVTAVLMAPIALQSAVQIGVSPVPFLFAVTVAASMCFASPFSTPPNALVMPAGQYTFMDYIKVGLPLQIIMGVVMVFVLPLLFPF
jgi:hypothetical protein